MKNLKVYLLALLCTAFTYAASAQGRVNFVNHTPNPAFQGNAVTALVNVNFWNSCDYFNTAYVIPNGTTLNVYLDFNYTSGFCLPVVTTGDISVSLGSLAVGSYTVNFYDWDSGAFEKTYYFTVYGSGGSNNCNNPALMYCGNTYFGNNGNGSYNYTTYYQGSTAHTGLTGPEMVYRFDLSTTSNVTINLSNLSVDCDLFLTPVCGPNNIIALSENSYASSETITYSNLAPGAYFVIVDGYSGAISNYNLSLNCSASGCGTPALSQLAATNISFNTATISCSVTGASLYQFRIKASSSSTWTTFNSSSSNASGVSNMTACTSYDFQCRVYCNGGWSNWSASKTFTTLCVQSCTAPSLSQIYTSNLGQTSVQLNCSVGGVYYYDWAYRPCGSSSWINLNSTTTNYTVITGLTPNTCYEYIVSVYCFNNTWSNWSSAGVFTTQGYGANNDEPCGAITLYPGYPCQPTYSSNIGATTTYNPAPPTDCNSYNMRDVWFRFTMPANGKVSYRTFAGSMTDALIAVYGGSSCTNLSYGGCVDDKNGNTMPYGTITGPAGGTVYIRVWGYNGSVGTFSICLETVISFTSDGAVEEDAVVVPAEYDADGALVMPFEAVTDRSGAQPISENTLNDAMALQVYPVPALNQVNLSIELPEDATVTIQLFDFTGKMVQEIDHISAQAGHFTETLDIASLPNGSYIAKVQAGEKMLTGRLMKVGN